MININKILKNKVKNLLEPPKYRINSKFLNKLNIQKIRCSYEQKKYLKKSLKYSDSSLDYQIKKNLDNFGYIIIENFFNQDDFNKLKTSFNNYKNSNKVNYQKNYYNLIWGSGIISENSSHKSDAKFIIDLFNSKKKEILNYVSYILKSKTNGNLELSYQDLMLMDGKKDNIDPNRNLHADRHYHCAKAYYLIDENNLNNSPYIYCPGSNIMTEKRKEIENELSKNKAFKNKNFYVNEEHLKSLNIKEQQIIVSPNSLVISDNIGFHKRGEMHHGFSRKQIRISFHGLQANLIQKSIRNIVRKYS